MSISSAPGFFQCRYDRLLVHFSSQSPVNPPYVHLFKRTVWSTDPYRAVLQAQPIRRELSGWKDSRKVSPVWRCETGDQYLGNLVMVLSKRDEFRAEDVVDRRVGGVKVFD